MRRRGGGAGGGAGGSLAGFGSQKAEPAVPSGLLKAARASGHLDLTGRGLKEVPQSVYRVNADTPEEANQNVSFGAADRWWEQTDLTKLLLSSNELAELSDDIRLLPALTTLDLHDNKLSSLPSALGELQQLQQLRLSHNQLTVLPVELCVLRSLRCLSLQKNLLEELPAELGGLEGLTELVLSNNHLKSLPSSLGRLTDLQKLDLSHNMLTCLPDCLGQLASVKLLDLSNNQLIDVPGSISQMVSLEQLFLRHNKLRLLPQLPAPNLKEVYLGNNQVDQLGAESLRSLLSVSVLELRDNKIQSLPDDITALKTLTRLDLTNNNITTLPASLSLLPELKMLLLEGNPLRGIRRDLLTKGTNELLKYLRGRIEVDPDTSQEDTAMTLPSQTRVNLHNIKTLKTLDYSNQQAACVPEDVFDAAAGETVCNINLSKNHLTALPPRLVEFQASVSEVNVGFNRLTDVSALCSLLQLTHLDLRNNQLTELPSDLESLKNLRSITLNCNRFKLFPEVLYQMVLLETVLLGNNQVGGVDPGRLMQLVNLSTLDLSNNDLLNVPAELGLCTSLRCLSLDGNPFRMPRAAILAKGTDAVLEYLRSRIPT